MPHTLGRVRGRTPRTRQQRQQATVICRLCWLIAVPTVGTRSFPASAPVIISPGYRRIAARGSWPRETNSNLRLRPTAPSGLLPALQCPIASPTRAANELPPGSIFVPRRQIITMPKVRLPSGSLTRAMLYSWPSQTTGIPVVKTAPAPPPPGGYLSQPPGCTTASLPTAAHDCAY